VPRLWAKDLILAGTAASAVALATAVVLWLFPAAVWILTPAVACAALALVVLEVYRRLQIQLKEAAYDQHEYLNATYHQIEALLSVINTIRPSFPLPETRTWSASPDILNHLCRLVLTRQPELVFEAGSGISTLLTAHCLRRIGKGHIVSLEHDRRFGAATRQLLADHGLSDIASIVDAPLKEIALGGQQWLWYDVDRIPPTHPIDLLFVDGPPAQTQPLARYPAVPVLASRLAPGCVVVLDDGARSDERAIAERWATEFEMTSEYLHTEKGAYVMTANASSSVGESARLASTAVAPSLQSQTKHVRWMPL
jgi:predicted O-methyltransferase YrrM